MHKLYFITGNKHKLEEVKSLMPFIEQLDIELPELQELDPHKIIQAKIMEAKKHCSDNFIVEDTGLYIDDTNGFPGPLIKWVLQGLGREKFAKSVAGYGNNKAHAKTIIGLYEQGNIVTFFEGSVEGQIVSPRGDSGFGWDPLFVPAGSQLTFAEMGSVEKGKISMRKKAVEQLKEYLISKQL